MAEKLIEQEKVFMKSIFLTLAKEHKKRCHKADCGVSLHWLWRAMSLLEVEVNKDEVRDLI
jgi:hypothetical protein